MSDGVINMALLNFNGKGGIAAFDLEEGSTLVGAHHFGIQVDDLVDRQKRIATTSGKFFFEPRPRASASSVGPSFSPTSSPGGAWRQPCA